MDLLLLICVVIVLARIGQGGQQTHYRLPKSKTRLEWEKLPRRERERVLDEARQSMLH